jgi:hypothetical protein
MSCIKHFFYSPHNIITFWNSVTSFTTPCHLVVGARHFEKNSSVSNCSACDVELHYIVHPSPCSGRSYRITSSARTRWCFGDRSLIRAQRVWAPCTAAKSGLTDVTCDVTFFSASPLAYRENRCNFTSKPRWSHIQGSKTTRIFRSIKIFLQFYTETSITYYPVTRRHIQSVRILNAADRIQNGTGGLEAGMT